VHDAIRELFEEVQVADGRWICFGFWKIRL